MILTRADAARHLRTAAWAGTEQDGPEYLRRCLVVDRPLGAQVIFTRQVGVLFRALHLSVEPGPEVMLTDVAARQAAALFVEGQVLPFDRPAAVAAWMALLYQSQRVPTWRRGVGHVLVFCDDDWQPAQPSDVVALRCRTSGWVADLPAS